MNFFNGDLVRYTRNFFLRNPVSNLLKDFLFLRVSEWATPKKDIKLPGEIYSPAKYSKISFCTTCMGRTFHLKKTYLKNILDNIEYPQVEFILLNYHSGDDMESWAKEHLQKYIEQGIVTYYQTPDPQKFHPSLAKNLAHRLATGDILVNLDADNFLGKDNAFFINYHFQKRDSKICMRFSKHDFRYFDTYGRIALTRADFEKINGYREDFEPYGVEDLDIIRRMELLGATVQEVQLRNFLRTVKHSNQLRVANFDKDHQDLAQMKNANVDKVIEGIKNKQFKANPNGFTRFTVYKNFSKEPIEA